MDSPPSSPSSYSASCSSYAPSPSSSEGSEEEQESPSSEDDQRRTKPKQTATPTRGVPREKRDNTHRSNSSGSSRHRRRRPDSNKDEEDEEEEEEETEEDEEATEEEEEETEGESSTERRQGCGRRQYHHQPHHHQRHRHHQRHHQHQHHEHRQHHHHVHHQPRNVYRRHVVRGAHQKRVDAVDIPAPAEWLYHDACAALRLRWEAQADLQLYADQKRRHKPRSQGLSGKRRVERGLLAAMQRVTNSSKIQHFRKAPRLVVGGDLLPWGTWPTRLRNHDGQSFYAGGGGGGGGGGSGGRDRDGGGGGGGSDILLLRDAVDGPFAACWAGSGGVGCSGGVEGVDSVTEGSIHDQLLLGRSLASPSSSPSPSSASFRATFGCSSSSLRGRLRPRQRRLSGHGGGGDDNDDDVAGDDDSRERHHHHDHHEGIVRRLVPDGRGRWVEARAVERPRRATGAAASGSDIQGATAAAPRSRSRSRSPPTQETPSAAAATTTTAPAPVVAKRLVPGWYGGWIEVEDTPGQTARAAAAAASAAADAARFGRGDGATRSVVEPSRKISGRKRQRDERVLGTARGGGQKDGTGGAAGGRGDGDESVGGGGWGRRGCGDDSGVHTCGGGEGLSDSDCGGGDGDGGSGGGGWQGWTVSEPAKEAVRRVWSRATRRARDAFEPRHRCDAVTTDCCPTAERKRERGGEAAAAVDAAGSCHAAAAAAATATAAAAAAATADNDGEARGAISDDGVEGADSDDDIGGDDTAARGPNGRNNAGDRSSTLEDLGGDGTGDNWDEPWPPRAAAAGGVRDSLDPGLLSCLGRECEGIIDAALHVVLGEQLLRSSSGCADGNPPEAADWEDVLGTMLRCSERARRACPREPNSSLHARGGGEGGRDGGGGRAGGRGRGRGRGGRGGGGGERGGGGGADSRMGSASSRSRRPAGGVCAEEECPQAVAASGREGAAAERGEIAKKTAIWGAGEPSDGAVVVVNERLPGLPLNEAVLTRSYNRLLVYLHEKKSWEA